MVVMNLTVFSRHRVSLAVGVANSCGGAGGCHVTIVQISLPRYR